MFIRFVIGTLDPRSGRRQSIFEAGRVLRLSGQCRPALERLDELRDWFSNPRKSRSRYRRARIESPSQAGSRTGLSCTSAHARFSAVEAYDIRLEMLRTERPGYIVYEDDHQVVAYPFADTPC
jgi:hypothetical protein